MTRNLRQHRHATVFEKQFQKVRAFLVAARKQLAARLVEQAGQELETLLIVVLGVAEILDQPAIGEQLARDRKRLRPVNQSTRFVRDLEYGLRIRPCYCVVVSHGGLRL